MITEVSKEGKGKGDGKAVDDVDKRELHDTGRTG
jgi:hypothetical protein